MSVPAWAVGEKGDPIASPPPKSRELRNLYLCSMSETPPRVSTSAVGILKNQAETPLVRLFAICSLTY